MPAELLATLRDRSGLQHRSALLACWGQNEERGYADSLGREGLQTLSIEHRPRRNLTRAKVAKIMSYQIRLLNSLPNLKTLTR